MSWNVEHIVGGPYSCGRERTCGSEDCRSCYPGGYTVKTCEKCDKEEGDCRCVWCDDCDHEVSECECECEPEQEPDDYEVSDGQGNCRTVKV